MRTVMFHFAGEPAPGDLIMLSYSHPVRGGRSTAKYTAKGGSGYDEIVYDESVPPVASVRHVSHAPDDLNAIVAALATEIMGVQSEWSPGAGDFKASAKGARLVVMCSDLLSDVEFSFAVEGKGTVTCEVEVI